jgi:hypothetical protein
MFNIILSKYFVIFYNNYHPVLNPFYIYNIDNNNKIKSIKEKIIRKIFR